MTITPTSPIDPLSDLEQGCYGDAHVVVERSRVLPQARAGTAFRTSRFHGAYHDGRLHLQHDLADAEIDDDLAGLLAAQLFDPGWVRGTDLFERIFTGVVRCLRTDPLDAWELFYRNTLARLGDPSPRPGGTIAGYAPVYQRAVASVRPGADVLELGSCFGFLSLLLAESGHAVTASDVSAGTMRLLGSVASRLDAHVDTCVADASRVALPDAFADTVMLVHLLEHLDCSAGEAALAEAQRLAARRVVVAVPFEQVADPTYGHVRTFDTSTLDAYGRASGWTYGVSVHHGGWLVLNRP